MAIWKESKGYQDECYPVEIVHWSVHSEMVGSLVSGPHLTTCYCSKFWMRDTWQQTIHLGADHSASTQKLVGRLY